VELLEWDLLVHRAVVILAVAAAVLVLRLLPNPEATPRAMVALVWQQCLRLSTLVELVAVDKVQVLVVLLCALMVVGLTLKVQDSTALPIRAVAAQDVTQKLAFLALVVVE